MKKLLIMALAVFVLSTPIYAGNFYEGEYKLRSVYFNIGLGYAYNKYDGKVMDAPDGYYKIGGYLDLGIYVPMNEQLLIGGIFDASFDRFTDSNNSDNYGQLTTQLLGASVLYYLDRVESGLYFRGDVGFSHASIIISKDGDKKHGSFDWGMGFTVGAGYAFVLDHVSSLGVNLFLSRKQIIEDDVETPATTIGVGVSFMF